jgi:hypothetical protein
MPSIDRVVSDSFEEGMPFLENSTVYTWNDWSVSGYTGICIWNFTSRWKENVKTSLHGIYHLIFKTYTVKGPSQKTLETWDRLCLKRQVVALGGSDAHGSFMRIGLLKFTPLSYRYLLGTINTHILTSSPLHGDFTTDKGIIYASLRLVSKLPKGGMITIIKDGSLFRRGYGGELSIKITENGVYRVEVFRKVPLFGWRPWIFSNPIYLR